MASKTFDVWVTLLSDKSADILVAGLVRLGCEVSPAATSGVLTVPGEVSSLCALTIKAEIPDSNPNASVWMRGHVRKILEDAKLSWYSIICVISAGGSSWTGSNIGVPKPEAKPEISAQDRMGLVLDG